MTGDLLVQLVGQKLTSESLCDTTLLCQGLRKATLKLEQEQNTPKGN